METSRRKSGLHTSQHLNKPSFEEASGSEPGKQGSRKPTNGERGAGNPQILWETHAVRELQKWDELTGSVCSVRFWGGSPTPQPTGELLPGPEAAAERRRGDTWWPGSGGAPRGASGGIRGHREASRGHRGASRGHPAGRPGPTARGELKG